MSRVRGQTLTGLIKGLLEAFSYGRVSFTSKQGLEKDFLEPFGATGSLRPFWAIPEGVL